MCVMMKNFPINPNTHQKHLAAHCLFNIPPKQNLRAMAVISTQINNKNTTFAFSTSGSPLIKQHWNWPSVSQRNRHNRRRDWPFCHQEQSSDSFFHHYGLLWRKQSTVFTFFSYLLSLFHFWQTTHSDSFTSKAWVINS